MRKTVEWDGRLFDVYVAFNSWGVNYHVWLVMHPERKHFFRSTYLDSKGYGLDNLESVEQGIWFAVQQVWKEEQNRLSNEKKIADFKKSC